MKIIEIITSSADDSVEENLFRLGQKHSKAKMQEIGTDNQTSFVIYEGNYNEKKIKQEIAKMGMKLTD